MSVDTSSPPSEAATEAAYRVLLAQRHEEFRVALEQLELEARSQINVEHWLAERAGPAMMIGFALGFWLGSRS